MMRFVATAIDCSPPRVARLLRILEYPMETLVIPEPSHPPAGIICITFFSLKSPCSDVQSVSQLPQGHPPGLQRRLRARPNSGREHTDTLSARYHARWVDHGECDHQTHSPGEPARGPGHGGGSGPCGQVVAAASRPSVDDDDDERVVAAEQERRFSCWSESRRA